MLVTFIAFKFYKNAFFFTLFLYFFSYFAGCFFFFSFWQHVNKNILFKSSCVCYYF